MSAHSRQRMWTILLVAGGMAWLWHQEAGRRHLAAEIHVLKSRLATADEPTRRPKAAHPESLTGLEKNPIDWAAIAAKLKKGGAIAGGLLNTNARLWVSLESTSTDELMALLDQIAAADLSKMEREVLEQALASVLIKKAPEATLASRDPATALRRAEEASGRQTGIDFFGRYCTTLDQQVAALKALRTWSGDDAGRQAKLEKFIQEQTLKHGFQETVRFESVHSWIAQAELTRQEISFLGDRANLDLCYHIDPRDTGKWIEWLDETFPEGQSMKQIKHLMEDYRTTNAAKAWLATLPLEKAAALEKRLAGE